MRQYKDLLRHILANGELVPTRAKLQSTGEHVRAISVIGYQAEYDLEPFPLLTTKEIKFDHVAIELFWMLNGLTNVSYLNERGVHIWDQWRSPEGDLGPTYGKVWRDCEGTDQVMQLVDNILKVRKDPEASEGRRLILNAWHVPWIPEMRLPPCHCFSQFFVRRGRLHCKLYQRSADAFLGVPYNVASYALLAHILAKRTGLHPGRLTHSFGDLHIYQNHLPQVYEQLQRPELSLPSLVVHEVTDDLKDMSTWNYLLHDYQSHGRLKAEVAV